MYAYDRLLNEYSRLRRTDSFILFDLIQGSPMLNAFFLHPARTILGAGTTVFCRFGCKGKNFLRNKKEKSNFFSKKLCFIDSNQFVKDNEETR